MSNICAKGRRGEREGREDLNGFVCVRGHRAWRKENVFHRGLGRARRKKHKKGW